MNNKDERTSPTPNPEETLDSNELFFQQISPKISSDNLKENYNYSYEQFPTQNTSESGYNSLSNNEDLTSTCNETRIFLDDGCPSTTFSTNEEKGGPSCRDSYSDLEIKLSEETHDEEEKRLSLVKEDAELLSASFDSLLNMVQQQEKLLSNENLVENAEEDDSEDDEEEEEAIENLKKILTSDEFFNRNNNETYIIEGSCGQTDSSSGESSEDDIFSDDNTYEMYYPVDNDSLNKNLDFLYFNKLVNITSDGKDDSLDPIREESPSELEEYEKDDDICQFSLTKNKFCSASICLDKPV